MILKNIFDKKLLLLFSILFLTGCNDSDDHCHEQYFKGYAAGRSGKKAPSSYASRKERTSYEDPLTYDDGYDDGYNDFLSYNDGYDDGYNNKKPEDPDDADYMDGYKDGKKHKEEGY